MKPRQRLAPDRRREQILRAAAEQFSTRPYAQVTVSAVAAKASASDALIYRYFKGKEELYTELVRMAIDELAEQQRYALESLPEGTPVRERIRRATFVYLDHIAARPNAWATPIRYPGSEPKVVGQIREEARAQYVEYLAGMLRPSTSSRHDYALWGYYGFVDSACLRWVDRGCPPDERSPLVESILGALEGALGDWSA